MAKHSVESDFRLLGVTSGAACDQTLRKAYRRAARKWHPDKNPQRKQEAEDMFKRINAAYERLIARVAGQHDRIQSPPTSHPRSRADQPQPADGDSPRVGRHDDGQTFGGDPSESEDSDGFVDNVRKSMDCQLKKRFGCSDPLTWRTDLLRGVEETSACRSAEEIIMHAAQRSFSLKGTPHPQGFRTNDFSCVPEFSFGVRSRWSATLNEHIRGLATLFGARVSASCDEDRNKLVHSAYERYRVKFCNSIDWKITFDQKGLETFLVAYPRVLGPSDDELSDFLEGYFSERLSYEELQNNEDLLDSLEKHFGPLTPTLRRRCIALLSKHIEARFKTTADSRPCKRSKKQLVLNGSQDACWAAEMLAPFGLMPDGRKLAVRSPQTIVNSVLIGLRSLQPSLAVLKQTSLPIIVGNYIQNSNCGVACLAKELMKSWKAACIVEVSSICSH